MKRELIYVSIGKIIRAKRLEKRWGQDVVAKGIGVSRGTLANIESGRQRILVHQLYALADALACRIDQLLPPRRGNAPAQSKLPFPEDLSQEQQTQLADLIGAVTTPARNPTTPSRAANRKGQVRTTRN